jgi:hypothetical protein
MDAMTPPDMTEQGVPQTALAQLQAMSPDVKPVTHDVKIVTTKKTAQARAMGVPPEEFGIERGARTIKDCNYCFHETIKTVDELTSQGFDEKQLNDLVSDQADNTENLSRDTVDETLLGRDTLNLTARPVRVTEHYIRMDYEGTGRACIYRVTTAGEGGDILKREGKEDIERVDEYPFASATPVPQPHRFFGRSVADLLMQNQREKTALKRGALDNMYLHNNPRPVVSESNAGVNTIDDLLVSRHGAPIRTKTPGGIEWQVWPDITGSIYPMMQYIDAEIESKTGVNRQTQGIDANALQNQSATAVAQVFSASQMRMKLIARVLAEGVKDMFSLLHTVIRKHGQQAETVRLRNKWVEVNPRQWKTRADMTIHVGLGTGGKAQQFAQVMALANVQKEMLAGGKANLVDDVALFNTATELVKIMGYKNPDKFFNDPQAKDPKTGQPLHPPVQPPEDPKITIAKMQAETDAKADERKAQIEAVQMKADIEANNKKIEGDIVLNREKAEIQERLAVLQFQLDNERDQREHDFKMAQLQAKTAADREKHEQTMEAGVFKVAAGAQAHDMKMEQGEQSHETKMEQMKSSQKDKTDD